MSWLREEHACGRLATLGFDEPATLLLSRVLTATKSQAQHLDEAFVDSDGDWVRFFSASGEGGRVLKLSLGNGHGRRVMRFQSAGGDSVVVLLQDGTSLQAGYSQNYGPLLLIH